MKNNWEKVEKIFHTTLDLPSGERKTYLQKACAGDGQLFSEIESLIDSLESEPGFLAEPVFELGLGAMHKNGQKSFAGTTIGFYEIHEKIGAGGMGDVYKAVDTRLNRPVALKFLSESLENDRAAKRQLVKEAQAAAALEHPNICAVHGIEQTGEHHFIVMQYIEGRTLAEIVEKESIGVDNFKSLARQIVTAVAFAHSHGVIHRDLKPGNIMLTTEKYIKVLDFGLAKVIRQKHLIDGEIDNKSNFSQNGLVIGTVSYMSPEQLRGEKIDYRSDIFSVGIVLYELLTKKNPFSRKSQAETIAAILSDKPPRPEKFKSDFPAGLINLVEKCLQKEPEKRFQSAAEILVELDKAESENYLEIASKRRRKFFIKAAAAAVILAFVLAFAYFYAARRSQRTIAILPISFENPPAEKEYLAGGLTQSIIDKLSNLSDLDVKSEFLIARYKGKTIEPRAAGKELNVDAVYAGAIINRADDLFFNYKLIRTSDGVVIASDEIKIEESKLIELQENVTSRIINEVKSNLTDEDKNRLAKKDTGNDEAKRLYFLGRYYLNRRMNDDVNNAVKSFNRAKELDPTYAKAWAGLADAYLSQSLPGVENAIPPVEAVGNAKAAAKTALLLDNTLCESYNSLGMISLKYEWNWTEAESYFRTAIARDPDFLPSRVGLINVLSNQERYDEALEEAKKIKETDSLSILSDAELAKIYYRKHDFEQMDKIITDLFDKNPDNTRLPYLQSYLFLKTGKYKEAIGILEKTYQSEKISDKVFVSAPLGFAYAKANRPAEALKLIENLDVLAKKIYVPAQERAVIYIGLGDVDKAFEYLNKSCAERYSTLPSLITDPLVDDIKSDARFAAVKKCANL
ncbi:MAG TPA: protein kinase [Pyrinomonadaceae bacterium]